MKRLIVLSLGLTTVFATLYADEGMWTFDNPPTKQLQERYGFKLTQEWLDNVRLSSVRLNDGGSGSFVSADGLLLTNHHVARGQLQKNSTPEHNYIEDGFYAPTLADEMPSPDLEINILQSMENVTERVQGAPASGATPEEAFAARRAEIAKIEKESLDATGLRSDVVTLYQGGEYWLYRYKRYTDVRLVFAPEQQIAFFGGDSDNFTYPRYDLDMALFRVYENGQPIHTDHYLKWNPEGAEEGDLVFVSGNPGSTERLSTLAQLQAQRDVWIPAYMKILNNRVETLREYTKRGADQALQAGSMIFGLENSIKAYTGRLKGLEDPNVMATKQADEERFRAAVKANPEWQSKYGNAWGEIADAEKLSQSRLKEEYYRGLYSDLANIARTVVRYVEETAKPDGERLPGFHDSQLQSLDLEIDSPAPIYKEMEIARIKGALDLDIEESGPDDEFVKLVLNGQTPEQAARRLVEGSRMDDPAYRRELIKGGMDALKASKDTMIQLELKLDPMRRELEKWTDDNVTSVVQQAEQKIGEARFAVYGKTTYPDATFTLRLSYGQVKGYPMNGTMAPAKTTIFGLYGRAADFNYEPPFDLPARWLNNEKKLNLGKAMDMVTTHDIIGGNSGSPVINTRRRAGRADL